MKEFELKNGMVGEARARVTEDNTAVKFGSGKVNVFGTPAMVALMEEASIKAVDSQLPGQYVTVGTDLKVRHMAATPIGMYVTASAKLVNIDGRKLTFKVEAFDEKEKVGQGDHFRYIVELDKFIDRAESKAR